MPPKAAHSRQTLGRHHPLLKRVRGMVRSGELIDAGEVLLETPKLIQDAMASGVRINQVLLRSDAAPQAASLADQLAEIAPPLEVPQRVFADLTTTQSSPGILALAQAPIWREEDLFSATAALIIILAGVQDPGNVGTILRTAEAFGTTGALLTGGSVSPYNAKVIRAASGTLFRLPTLTGYSAGDVLRLIREHNILLMAAVASGGKWLSTSDTERPLAIAFGSEGGGLPRELEQAALPVSIPMSKNVESLNVAAVAAVLLYEINRSRTSSKTPNSKSQRNSKQETQMTKSKVTDAG